MTDRERAIANERNTWTSPNQFRPPSDMVVEVAIPCHSWKMSPKKDGELYADTMECVYQDGTTILGESGFQIHFVDKYELYEYNQPSRKNYPNNKEYLLEVEKCKKECDELQNLKAPIEKGWYLLCDDDGDLYVDKVEEDHVLAWRYCRNTEFIYKPKEKA